MRELLEDGEIKLAYTTVMTTLDRLYKKQLLDRTAEGRAFRYVTRFTQAELERTAVSETVRQMLEVGESATLPLSYLVEAVGDHDVSLLDDLQRLLDEKRRQVRSELRRGRARKEKH